MKSVCYWKEILGVEIWEWPTGSEELMCPSVITPPLSGGHHDRKVKEYLAMKNDLL